VLVTLPAAQAAGSMIHIETESGEEVLTFVSTKSFETAVFSSPELENGATYLVYTGGSSTGTETDGLYTDGTYTAGTQASSFTISSIVTGESAGMGSRGGGKGGRP
jgi:hypothetical protein